MLSLYLPKQKSKLYLYTPKSDLHTVCSHLTVLNKHMKCLVHVAMPTWLISLTQWWMLICTQQHQEKHTVTGHNGLVTLQCYQSRKAQLCSSEIKKKEKMSTLSKVKNHFSNQLMGDKKQKKRNEIHFLNRAGQSSVTCLCKARQQPTLSFCL